ncbi:MAG: Lipid-A-disaccharide synthase [Alphaproteobacteria bacterium MarineAlpha5_Bin8]|nr:MAG: Lipid-A-disaccharide synthase [Alphaproteobacteria bacterium MarineAlpha5_Bin7]PPR46570.1 MAG: Lipid-A-disaccharide synthase [Alphaproteobacteria bacterium MarineAlpha5_Bin8]PPR53117.1 MAG: Lipid-A-disaccharide synthase [Alphaproteobacteria bacterium MarineAlpha5_Bin6]
MKNNNKKKIFICATEQSGDNIGSKIIKELKKEKTNIIIDGVGGFSMKSFQRNQIYSLKEFKSIGIIEVLFSLLKYLRMINIISNYIIKNNYDLIITIDSPDFNYPLIKKLRKKKYKGKIIQIVAPSVWAWRANRAKKFAEVFDEIYTLFPFENKFFEKYNLKSTYIGHPIFDIKKLTKVSKNNKIIAFLPGSRLGEINKLFKYFELAYEYLILHKSKYIILIPTLPHLEKEIKSKTKNWKIKTIVTTDNKKIEKLFLKTKIALVCSGTASLEIAKRNIPQLILYKLNYITEIIINCFIKIKFANIINILEQRMIIPELLNSKLKNEIFLKKFKKLLLDESANKKQIKEINKVLKNIELSRSPYKIAVHSIKKYL